MSLIEGLRDSEDVLLIEELRLIEEVCEGLRVTELLLEGVRDELGLTDCV